MHIREFLTFLVASCFSIVVLAQAVKVENASSNEVHWLTWNEAIAMQKIEKKPVFIDIYTSWCGWCKKMDQTTFMDPKVVNYLNKYFYAVKFDAEQKEEIIWDGKQFNFAGNDRNGAHELAISLMDGRLGYPTTVILEKDLTRILLSPGYKNSDALLSELKFSQEQHYKKMSWEDFRKIQKAQN